MAKISSSSLLGNLPSNLARSSGAIKQIDLRTDLNLKKSFSLNTALDKKETEISAEEAKISASSLMQTPTQEQSPVDTSEVYKQGYAQALTSLTPELKSAREGENAAGGLGGLPGAAVVAAAGAGAAGVLASAAGALQGMSSAAGPDGGNKACVWAVNQVFAKAGLKPPWGNSNSVPDAEAAMIRSGYASIPIGQQRSGDLYICHGQQHIGIVLPDGNIISNSSSGAKFSWVASLSSYQQEYRGPGKFYRIPEVSADKTKTKEIKPASKTQTAAALKPSTTSSTSTQTLIQPIITQTPAKVASQPGSYINGGSNTSSNTSKAVSLASYS